MMIRDYLYSHYEARDQGPGRHARRLLGHGLGVQALREEGSPPTEQGNPDPNPRDLVSWCF